MLSYKTPLNLTSYTSHPARPLNRASDFFYSRRINMLRIKSKTKLEHFGNHLPTIVKDRMTQLEGVMDATIRAFTVTLYGTRKKTVPTTLPMTQKEV